MQPFDVQVCLVSDQAAPNLLPLIDKQFAPKRVILLVTPQMKKQAGWLYDAVRPTGIQVKQLEINPDESFDVIQDFLMDLLADEHGSSVALNVTGGTKWLAIAAHEVFRADDRVVFYVDAATDEIRYVGQNIEPYKLQESIKVKNYLETYGYRITEEGDSRMPQKYTELCQQLVLKVKDWEVAIGALNSLANQAQHEKSLTGLLKDDPVDRLDALLHECEHAGLLQRQGANKVCFVDDKAREFCNGGWLEFYVNKLLVELKGRGVLQDSPHLNVKLERDGNKNEIDVAFMAHNRLHIIECKTKRLTGKQTGMAGTEAVYKLDSLSSLGGLGTKAMLLSYRRLKDADRLRAKNLGIKVVEQDQLHALKIHLGSWIAG